MLVMVTKCSSAEQDKDHIAQCKDIPASFLLLSLPLCPALVRSCLLILCLAFGLVVRHCCLQNFLTLVQPHRRCNRQCASAVMLHSVALCCSKWPDCSYTSLNLWTESGGGRAGREPAARARTLKRRLGMRAI